MEKREGKGDDIKETHNLLLSTHIYVCVHFDAVLPICFLYKQIQFDFRAVTKFISCSSL